MIGDLPEAEMAERVSRQEEQRVRAAFADEILQCINEVLDSYPPAGTKAHWDDCCCDSRTFWVHFRCVRERMGRPGKDSFVRATSQLIRHAIGECKELGKASSYQLVWDLQTSPKPQFWEHSRYARRNRRLKGWSDDTWVYTLTMYGGPGAVAISQLTGKRSND